MIGTVLKHRYEVQEKIGEGNLFAVYKAEDKIDNRPAAVKVLHSQYAANRVFAERILVEAHAMLGVSHPSIAEVYDCGEENGVYFVVVEYVRGVDLKERIRRSAPFALATAVDVGIAICDALDFAHRRGFVHGDLRPGNVLVTPEGCVKLTDFWVSDAVASSQSIRTSAMMRSIHYMSPEVAEGKPASPASDIYSLGIILFEILTANLPFDGDTPILIALKHSRDPIPSVRAINPGVPKSLEALLAKALQKAPQSRFRSAKAMLNEMKSVRQGLNLSRPVAWSPVTEKTIPEPLPEPEEAEELAEAEPVLLSALLKTLAVTVGIIGVLVAAVATWVWMNPGEVKVPEIVGKDLPTARALARSDDIHLVVKAEEFNEKSKKGVIYLSNPGPGRYIKAGKSVDVWVSRGSKYTRTPKLVNLPEATACKRILAAGLVIGELSQDYSDSVAPGNVMKQSPRPNTRQGRNKPVNLVVSLGPKPPEEATPMAGPDDYVGGPRMFDVKFTVPKGRENQIVQIVVVDDYGENVVYSSVGHPGDRVEQTVEGFGAKVTIRIYIDEKLVKEQRQWR